MEDILENIVHIEEFTLGMDEERFIVDLKTTNATERCLERISEAARKLGDVAEQLFPGIAWAKLRAIGNLLRHEYDRVDVGRVWLMVEMDLPPLKAAVEAALKQIREQNKPL